MKKKNKAKEIESVEGMEVLSLKSIAESIQKTIELNDSNLEDKDGNPLGFQFPKEIIEKLDETRFLCLLTDAYLSAFSEFFKGDQSIQTFIENLDKAKAALK